DRSTSAVGVVEIACDGRQPLVGRFDGVVDDALAGFANAVEKSRFDDIDQHAPSVVDVGRATPRFEAILAVALACEPGVAVRTVDLDAVIAGALDVSVGDVAVENETDRRAWKTVVRRQFEPRAGASATGERRTHCLDRRVVARQPVGHSSSSSASPASSSTST